VPKKGQKNNVSLWLAWRQVRQEL